MILTGAVDPNSIFADPDSDVLLNADTDPDVDQDPRPALQNLWTITY